MLINDLNELPISNLFAIGLELSVVHDHLGFAEAVALFLVPRLASSICVVTAIAFSNATKQDWDRGCCTTFHKAARPLPSSLFTKGAQAHLLEQSGAGVTVNFFSGLKARVPCHFLGSTKVVTFPGAKGCQRLQ